jgi:hypothetical protein
MPNTCTSCGGDISRYTSSVNGILNRYIEANQNMTPLERERLLESIRSDVRVMLKVSKDKYSPHMTTGDVYDLGFYTEAVEALAAMKRQCCSMHLMCRIELSDVVM